MIAEKNMVESLLGMLSGLSSNPSLSLGSYTRIPDSPPRRNQISFSPPRGQSSNNDFSMMGN